MVETYYTILVKLDAAVVVGTLLITGVTKTDCYCVVWQEIIRERDNA